MMEPRYNQGQKVKIITLIDGFGRPDPRISDFIGRSGEVVKFYMVSPDEVWEKTLKFIDVYCYDVRLDDGDIARGIPEQALEPSLPW